MKIFLSFLKYHIKALTALAVTDAVFGIIFWLYGLPIEPFIYALVLSAVIIACTAAVDLYFFRLRHKKLEISQSQIDADLSNVPKPENLIEKDMIDLISALYDERRALESEKERTIKQMTEYYTVWAHQMKTPIAAMSLLLQSREEVKKAELSEQLFRIEEYTEMVLTYLRCEGHMSDFVMKQVSLDNVVKQAVRKYRGIFIKKGIVLEYENHGEGETLGYVITDEKWLTFVLEQLLSNALKYTEKGKISIYCAENIFGPKAQAPSAKILCIEDTGIGIAPEDIPRVTECGFTGYNGHADRKSTGIGLYLCKQIMTRLGFSMWIESEVGVGTRVYLQLG